MCKPRVRDDRALQVIDLCRVTAVEDRTDEPFSQVPAKTPAGRARAASTARVFLECHLRRAVVRPRASMSLGCACDAIARKEDRDNEESPHRREDYRTTQACPRSAIIFAATVSALSRSEQIRAEEARVAVGELQRHAE